MSEHDATQVWEEHYAGADAVWSGRPNQALVDTVADLPAGRALDIGSGEGADAIWLARRGWQVTGIDISPTASSRAAEAARQAGLPDEAIRWLVRDLTTWPGEGEFDLVSAFFLHSRAQFDRTDVLRRVANLVAPGGHLLIVSHAAFPPWSTSHAEHGHADHEPDFLTPDEEVEALALPDERWETVVAETRPRQATSPDGQQAVMDDVVVLLRRR